MRLASPITPARAIPPLPPPPHSTHKRTCDHAEVCLGLKGVQHLDDVLVAQLAQDLNLLRSLQRMALGALLRYRCLNQLESLAALRCRPPTCNVFTYCCC